MISTLLARLAVVASGAAALIYGLSWIRLAGPVFGSTAQALSVVAAVLLAGLALGGEFAGRLAGRSSLPLHAFSVLSIMLAALGVFSLPAFAAMDAVYGLVFPLAAESPVALTVFRLLLAALVLLPPCVIIGATLPLFARQWLRSNDEREAGAASLFGFGMLGAAAGCVWAAATLVPGAGLRASVMTAAALNLMASVAALPASLRGSPVSGTARPVDSLDGPVRLVTVAVFGAGFVAFAQQVLWTRQLSLLVASDVYMPLRALGVVLGGAALGSFLVGLPGRWLCATPARAARSFGGLQVALGLTVLYTALQPPSAWIGRGTGLTVYGILLAPAAMLAGASVPVAVRILVRGADTAASGVGRLLAVSMAGGIAGAMSALFLLLPSYGLRNAFLVTTGLSVALGVVVWRQPGMQRSRRKWPLYATGMALIAWFAIPRALDTQLPEDFLAMDGELLEVYEGTTANVAVLRQRDVLQLEVDRWRQGSAEKTHRSLAMHIPLILHADPQRVLIVGAGAGQGGERTLMHAVGRVDVLDAEADVFTAIEAHFAAGWKENPRIRPLVDDGRSYLAHSGEQYDLISVDVGPLMRPGAARFYTLEFYRAARASLRGDGLLSQSVPIAFLTVDEFRVLVRTFLAAFPQAVLWYNTSDLLLLGWNGESTRMDDQRLGVLEGEGDVARDLHYAYWGGPDYWLSNQAVFLAGLLTGPGGLAAISDGAGIYRDDRPFIEFAAAARGAASPGEEAITALLRGHLEPADEVLGLRHAAGIADEIAAVRAINLDDIVASAVRRTAELLVPEYGLMAERLRVAVDANPQNMESNRLLADALVALGRPREAQTYYRRALAIDPDNGFARRGLGYVLFQQGDARDAIVEYRRALTVQPDDPRAHNNLGAALASVGEVWEAEKHFTRALELRPGYEDAQLNLDRLRGARRR